MSFYTKQRVNACLNYRVLCLTTSDGEVSVCEFVDYEGMDK